MPFRSLFAALLMLCAACAAQPYYSNLPLTPSRSIAESEDALRRGEYATAASGFSDYLASGQETFRARTFYQLAQAQYGLESYEAALDTLSDMEAEFPNIGAQPEVLRGDIDYALGRRVDAVVAWQSAWQRGTESDRVFIRSRIEEAMDELTPSERSQLADQLTDPEVRTVLGLGPANELGATAPEPLPPKLDAADAERESEADTAAGYAALEADPLPPADLAAGDALAAGARVACLLPLTGPDKAYGQRALSGLRLAFGGTGNMLMVRDTSNQPDLAAQLTSAIAADPAVLAIIGPLRTDTAEAVAPLAERLQMPTLLLARAEGLAGPYVLQTGATQAEQMRVLAAYAVGRRGYRHLGILYPDDGYGRSYMEAFRAAAQQAGASAVKTNAYRPGQQTFAAQQAATAAWVKNENVQAVFIPDAAEAAVAVAAAVRTAAPGIALLGTESWNQPATLAAAGASVDGAVFADSFVADPARSTSADFVSRFHSQNGYQPSGYEASSYDAGMLVREAIAGGARSRGALLEALRQTTRYEGAGSLRSGPSGMQRDLVLLEVRDGRVAALAQ
jgi:ABC-type branched-subunit amino acid transport system substrate-binding protein